MLLVAILACAFCNANAARNVPNKKGDGVSDEKNVINYSGVGVYSGIGNNGLPFGGIGGAAGTGGDLGGGLPGIGGGGLPGVGGTAPGISSGTGFPTIGTGNGFPTVGGFPMMGGTGGGGLPTLGGTGGFPGTGGGAAGGLPFP